MSILVGMSVELWMFRGGISLIPVKIPVVLGQVIPGNVPTDVYDIVVLHDWFEGKHESNDGIPFQNQSEFCKRVVAQYTDTKRCKTLMKLNGAIRKSQIQRVAGQLKMVQLKINDMRAFIVTRPKKDQDTFQEVMELGDAKVEALIGTIPSHPDHKIGAGDCKLASKIRKLCRCFRNHLASRGLWHLNQEYAHDAKNDQNEALHDAEPSVEQRLDKNLPKIIACFKRAGKTYTTVLDHLAALVGMAIRPWVLQCAVLYDNVQIPVVCTSSEQDKKPTNVCGLESLKESMSSCMNRNPVTNKPMAASAEKLVVDQYMDPKIRGHLIALDEEKRAQSLQGKRQDAKAS